ncbi:hypothetical protein ACLOJK_029952 [Asimina triloba]
MLSSLQIRRFLSLMSNPPQHRGSFFGPVWARKLGKEIAIAAVGLTILFFIASSSFDSWRQGRRSSVPAPLASDLIDITLVRNAKKRGADDKAESNLFNWNKVRIRYCDGASFSGNVESEDVESEVQNGTKVFFRGQHIWEAVMDELLSIGLAHAKQRNPIWLLQKSVFSNETAGGLPERRPMTEPLVVNSLPALLSGCSAGGLATLIHCDDFHAHLPKSATVKCLSDGGFFLDEKDIAGRSTMRSFYHDVVRLQGVEKSLKKECTSKMEPSQAGFRDALLNSLQALEHNKDVGMFINSCYIHCQTWMVGTWHSLSSPRINNKVVMLLTIAEAVGDWYFNRRVSTEENKQEFKREFGDRFASISC